MSTSLYLYKIPDSPPYLKQTGLSNQGFSLILKEEIDHQNKKFALELNKIKSRFTSEAPVLSHSADFYQMFGLFYPTIYSKIYLDENKRCLQKQRFIPLYLPLLALGLSVAYICSGLIYHLDIVNDLKWVEIAFLAIIYYSSIIWADYTCNSSEDNLVHYFQKSIQTEKALTVFKIQTVIDRLNVFPEKQIDIKHLGKEYFSLNLTKASKLKILEQANFRQLAELKQIMQSQFYNEFVADPSSLDSKQKIKLLSLLCELQNLEIEPLLNCLTDQLEAMTQDPTLWQEIVKSLSPQHIQNQKVKDLLCSLGAKIIQPGVTVDSLIETLQIKSSEEVIMQLEGVNTLFYINQKELMEYRLFQLFFSDAYKGNPNNTLEIPENDLKALPYLLQYIQNKHVEIPIEIIPSLLSLSSRLQINDCVSDCAKLMDKQKQEY